MRCWVCGGTAEGVCRFCGRAVCKQHARSQAFLFNVWRTVRTLRGLAIDDALWCGVCRPRPQPLDLPFLDAPEDGEASAAPADQSRESSP